VFEMTVDRALRDEEPGGDLAVGEALRDHSGHLDFAGTQPN